MLVTMRKQQELLDLTVNVILSVLYMLFLCTKDMLQYCFIEVCSDYIVMFVNGDNASQA